MKIFKNLVAWKNPKEPWITVSLYFKGENCEYHFERLYLSLS